MENRVYEDEENLVIDKKLENKTGNLSHDKKELKFKTDIGNALSAGSVFIIKLKLILHLQNHFDPSQLFGMYFG